MPSTMETLVDRLPSHTPSAEKQLSETRKQLREALKAARSALASEMHTVKAGTKDASALSTFPAYESALNAYLSCIAVTQSFTAAVAAHSSEVGWFGALNITKHMKSKKKIAGALAVGAAAVDTIGPLRAVITIPAALALNKYVYKPAANWIVKDLWGAKSVRVAERAKEAELAAQSGEFDFKAFTGSSNLLEKKLPGEFREVSEIIKRQRMARLGVSAGSALGIWLTTGAGLSAHMLHDHAAGGESISEYLAEHWGSFGKWLTQGHGLFNLLIPSASAQTAPQTPDRPFPGSNGGQVQDRPWPTNGGGNGQQVPTRPWPIEGGGRMPQPQPRGGGGFLERWARGWGEQLQRGGRFGGSYERGGAYSEHYRRVTIIRVSGRTAGAAPKFAPFIECPPDTPEKITETPSSTFVSIDRISHPLTRLGTNPFSDAAHAYDATHVEKLIGQLRAAGKSEAYLKALEAKLLVLRSSPGAANFQIPEGQKFAWMASGGKLMTDGVELKTGVPGARHITSYLAEKFTFEYTENGVKHIVTMVRPAECNNFAEVSHEIITTTRTVVPGVAKVCPAFDVGMLPTEIDFHGPDAPVNPEMPGIPKSHDAALMFARNLPVDPMKMDASGKLTPEAADMQQRLLGMFQKFFQMTGYKEDFVIYGGNGFAQALSRNDIMHGIFRPFNALQNTETLRTGAPKDILMPSEFPDFVKNGVIIGQASYNEGGVANSTLALAPGAERWVHAPDSDGGMGQGGSMIDPRLSQQGGYRAPERIPGVANNRNVLATARDIDRQFARGGHRGMDNFRVLLQAFRNPTVDQLFNDRGLEAWARNAGYMRELQQVRSFVSAHPELQRGGRNVPLSALLESRGY